jgi:hypothetical protein
MGPDAGDDPSDRRSLVEDRDRRCDAQGRHPNQAEGNLGQVASRAARSG